MGKDKKSKRKSEAEEGGDKESRYDEMVLKVNAIAKPLASRKLTKRVYKLVKKAQQQKSLHKGVREVQKMIRKGTKGVVIFAGDVSPIDVICHMPAVCEGKNLPYCYAPSKDDLGAACGSKRATCMVLIKKNEDYGDLFDELSGEVSALPLPI